ncbi:hypothetical protein EDD36DRAFT_460417 [Exophiala viscosa]|uniref:Uncharacterized protein n=2 Tax=Exophiala viscosa TaxID=2486360 RepID=A0AAN6E669_9EURO|nr:hypothetical protein EDD36DRAFT_460417 [Exophiala viscosa]
MGEILNPCAGDLDYSEGATPGDKFSLTHPWTYQWTQAEADAANTMPIPTFNAEYNNITALYCLAEPFDSPCKVEVYNPLLLVVGICLFFKSAFAISTLALLWKSSPVQCLGDAIQLFLQQEESDLTTEGLCTYGQNEFRLLTKHNRKSVSTDMRPRWIGGARAWSSRRKSWGSAIPRLTWITTYLPICCVLVVVAVLFIKGLMTNDGFTEAGFGDDPNNGSLYLPDFDYGYGTLIVADLPQIIITACYFTFSSLYSALFQGREWSLFSQAPRRLKVTTPADGQDSSYLLSVPFFWGAVYLLISSVSPSDANVIGMGLHYSLGYSVQALVATLLLAAVALLIPLVLTVWPLPSQNSIIVGTNSAAISAQCQRLPTRRSVRVSAQADRRYNSANSEVSAEDNAAGDVDTGYRHGSEAGAGAEDGPGRAPAPDGDSVSESRRLLAISHKDDLVDGYCRQPEPGAEGEVAAVPKSDPQAQPAPAVAHQADPAGTEDDAPDNASQEVQLLDNDPDQTPRLQELRWGVLQPGGADSNNRGHLGLGIAKRILGQPEDGHWYR